MAYIQFCNNSTITEAWAVIIGTPGEVKDAEVGALEISASKILGGEFQIKPSFVWIEKKDNEKIVPPFWNKQLAWDNGKYLARIGHRYLSVHFLRQGNVKYDKYQTSLEPKIDAWLDAYEEILEGRKEKYPIERVGFGYVNFFRFPSKGFNLSNFFKVDFGTGAESAKNGLSTLEINFKFNHSETNSTILVNLDVKPESDQIIVVTKVEAQKPLNAVYTFNEYDNTLDIIKQVKEVAKTVFFDLTTDKTQKYMGAQYATDTT